MIKVFSFFMVLFFSASALSDGNSVSNVLNGNGSVGNVTINQTAMVSDETLNIQKTINDDMSKAYKQAQSGGDVVESNKTLSMGHIANDVNKQNATVQQKNQMCKSNGKLQAELLGYEVAFAFGKCDEYFTAH